MARIRGKDIKTFIRTRLPLLSRRRWRTAIVSLRSVEYNICAALPLYAPHSGGKFADRAGLTLATTKRIFPVFGAFAATRLGRQIQDIEPIGGFADTSPSGRDNTRKLEQLLNHYGSDKATTHNYYLFYAALFADPAAVSGVFEVGLGTNNPDVISNMGRFGRPGASLRAFRDYFPNANVGGADIDRRVLFEEERIRTFWVDQTEAASFEGLEIAPASLDLAIDDGLHSPDANLTTLAYFLDKIRVGGWFVVEDIAPAAAPFWQAVALLLQKDFEVHIIETNRALLFAVKRLL